MPDLIGLSVEGAKKVLRSKGIDAKVLAPSTATNNAAKQNTISNNLATNTTGFSKAPACGYQAGIADLGKKDLIVNNSVSGGGYTPVSGDCPFHRFIDITTKARGVPSNKI